MNQKPPLPLLTFLLCLCISANLHSQSTIHGIIKDADGKTLQNVNILLLKSADWLFNKRITNEIARVSHFDLSNYIDTAKIMINKQLNTEWIKGVKSSGSINDLKISGFYPLTDYFIIRSNANGELMIKVDAMNFNLQ